ncbi:transducin family protein/WD-40 repeat family protein [Forsythia ovata]|uniref:Transducin family protein/WD-40 repeat family protein n=1 Tax=Forsythia ovata TaxID=205694 RepID=A0ABD1QQW6_9LAMI
MEQSSTKVDLDSLLQSHGGVDSDSSDEEDSTSSHRHHRTVDEILLNNSSSSSSPSPPSSPKLSHSRPPTSVVEFNKFNSSTTSTSFDSSSSTRIKSGGENPAPNSFSLSQSVLPPLFVNGAARSKTKPGAALAAAAAASRSVPTPHAAAIKLRRANTSALQRLALEAAAIVTREESSSLSAFSKDSELSSEIGADFHGLRVLENISNHSEEEEVKLGVYQSAKAAARLTETVDTIDDPTESAQLLTSDETSSDTATADEHLTIVEQVSESHISSTVESEKQLEFNENRVDSVSNKVNENKQVLSSLSNNNNDVNAEINTVDESNEIKEMTVPSPPPLISNDRISSDENVSIIGREEASDQENVMDESSDGDDASSQNDDEDIVEEIVLNWVSKRRRRKSQKKSQSSLKPLELAEELEKKHAFKGMHYEEGVTSQPMRLEGVRRGSTVLGYFDVNANNTITHTISSQAFRRDHGSPQVLAVNFNYIALGMSKGTIVIVPSKYTPHQVDNMDAKVFVLGLQGDRSHVPVTSMCFNQPGDLLFAGYGDGQYTVWDVQRTAALKVITEHKAPVVHLLYVGQDTQVTRQFNVVSGDSKGVVKLIRFSVVPWLNRISYNKSMKLLDETTSRVVCASPLLSGEGLGGAQMSSQGSSAVSTSSIGSMMGSVVEEGVVIFVTHQSALVAKVNPSVEVYAQIPKPDGIREGAMPYAAWRCMSQSPASSTENVPADTPEKLSLLAIAWDRKVQIAKLVKSELQILEKWTLESPAVGLAWLDDQMLAILTLTRQLYLFAKDGNVIHQTSFAVDGLRGDDLISSHIYFTNTLGNPEKAHHNCVAVRGATIYILGPEHLIVSRLLPWKERIEVLRKAGDWMGALNMAMTLYDGQSHGVIDLPKNLDDIQRSVMPYLVELLLSYVSEVFSYISVACCNQNGKLDQSNEIKEQYTRVGGVAVEFCVHIRRTDILFDEIVSKFDEAQHKDTFLELLEPYILKDMLGSLPPAIMQALVEHYSGKGWLQRVEQCVLHMDILSLDFNQVVRLCREHRLHGALIYLFNKGLDDFRAPLEELLVVLRNSERESAASLGYRMLVYLKYCFQGLAFPPGHGNLSPTRLPSLRKELVQFLLEISGAPNAWTVRSLPSNGACPNLLHLLELDTEATLDVLRCAFTEEDEINHFSQEINSESAEVNDSMAGSQILVQKVVDVLAVILDASYFQTGNSISSDDINSIELWPSKKDAAHIYEFIAYYVACERANVSNDILTQIFEYLTSEINISLSLSGQTTEIIKRREKQLLALVEVVPETRWDTPYLLHLCEKAQFHQVCGCIHAIKHQYVAALDSYMKVTDEPILAFSFIHVMLQQLIDKEHDAFESAVISRIPDLVKLSREGTYILIVDHFSGQSQYILSELHSHPESLFLYLKTVIEVNTTGNLNLSSLKKDDILFFPSVRRARQQSSGVEAYLQTISGFPKLLHNSSVQVTDEMTELYLELLCQYERKSVLKFLETSESYRVEHCLRLCQEYRIVDAAAFLLERVGEVGSALLLILSDLNDKMIVLNAAIEDGLSGASLHHLNAILKRKEVTEILDIVHACIGLCQRNSPRLDPDESEHLWFQLLDSFCMPLMDSDSGRTNSRSEAPRETLDGSLCKQEDEEGCKIKWKVSKSHKGARIMRKLSSMFIKQIVEGMIGYVQLPRIMAKLLSDNGNQEFGDFKLTILGMLGTYDFERRILDTAKSLIEDDTYYTLSLLRKGASHGYSPWSLVCCICNGLLSKSSSDSGIQLFSCGHAIHLHCELPENEASVRGSSTGCPICMPRKKNQRSSSISLFAEDGLVSKSSSRSQQPHVTTALHQHDHDAFENSYGSQPMSRFEVLNNLQKEQKLTQMENMPPLRLAPPAVYHEKIKKRSDDLGGESSSRSLSKTEKPTRNRQLKDVKVKGSSVRFPLKSNIFGKEKMSKR